MATRSDLESATQLDDQVFEKLDLAGIDLSRKEIRGCTFKRCQASNSIWKHAVLAECVFEECDLANIALKGASLRDVQFRGCKLVGVTWADLSSDPDVAFTDCAMRYGAFSSVHLQRTAFTRCAITEATFIEVDLTKSKLVDCDLSKTTFERCNLTGTDFATSANVFFHPTSNRIKGARISSETAAHIATSLGLVVAR
jgi:fluoroquinolone resistance protein